MIRYPWEFSQELIGDPAKLRQLAASPPQVFRGILSLIARLQGTNEIENHSRDGQEVFVLLDFLGVLEKGAHHPRRSRDDVISSHGFAGRHNAPPALPRSASPPLAGVSG